MPIDTAQRVVKSKPQRNATQLAALFGSLGWEWMRLQDEMGLCGTQAAASAASPCQLIYTNGKATEHKLVGFLDGLNRLACLLNGSVSLREMICCTLAQSSRTQNCTV